MEKKRSDSNFVVDVRIHFQGRVVRFSFGRIIRWLVPAIAILYRAVSHLRDSSS